MSGVRAVASRAWTFLGVLVGGVLGVYESARVTVRLPLIVPVVLIGAVLVTIAVAFRRPRAPLVAKPQKAPQRTTRAWVFDDPPPDEESW